MLELWLVRHGQTDFSRENRFCGSIDPPLSDVGQRMAEALGESHGKDKWDAIYCSPSTRARQTATPLAKRAGKELVLDEGLREISYGDWEGMKHEEAKAKFPDVYAYWAQDTASRATPNGETAFMVASRAAPVVERIRREHDPSRGGRVLVVSHKATLRILVCALLGMDVRLFRDRIAQPVCALSRFEIKPQGIGGSTAMLTMLGDVSHLPADLRIAEGT
ncbi:MAG TPA: histidine phosphatase family protein [Polyangiaceae bacterium]|jgi:probable phosphoglycerate mutase|nr:histidine phosphatase family protein [Polyangiaceae bacterium]